MAPKFSEIYFEILEINSKRKKNHFPKYVPIPQKYVIVA